MTADAQRPAAVRAAQLWRSAGAFVVSLGLLAVLVWTLGPASVVADLAGADFRLVALGLAAVLFAVGCWSEGHRRLLRAGAIHLRPGRCLGAYTTGLFAKQVLPTGQAGGVAVMAYAVHRDAETRYDHALTVVALGETLGVLASTVVAGLGLALFVWTSPPFPGTGRLVAVVVAVFLVISGGLAVLVTHRPLVERTSLRVAGVLRRTLGRRSGRVAAATAPESIRGSVERVYGALADVGDDPDQVLLTAGFMTAGWLLVTTALYTSFLAVGASLQVALALFVVPMSGLAAAVPLPGGLGSVELVLVALLATLTGLTPTEVAAPVLLYRVCTYWFFVLVGGTGSLARVLLAR